MRPLVSLCLTAAVLVGSVALAQPVRADDFDDDFGEPAPAPAPQPAPTPPSGGGGGGGGGFDDDFGEPAPAPAPARKPASASGSAGASGSASASGSVSGSASTGGATAGSTVLDPFDDGFDGEPPAAEAAEAAPAADAASEADAAEPSGEVVSGGVSRERAEGFRAHATQYGPVGGLRVVDAGSGAPKTFRLQLMFDWFAKDGFLQGDDGHRRVGASLALSWTPIEHFEFAMSMISYANANDQEDPALFQVLGDTHLFFRGYKAVLPFMTVGGDFQIAMLNTVGDIGLVAAGTSFGLRGNVSFDLRKLRARIPMQARFNLHYYFDQSSKLIRDVETARYNSLVDANPEFNEHRHLVTNIERFAFNINRTDALTMGFGFEWPIALSDTFFLHPLLEWQVALPINRQGYNCLFRPGTDDVDSCLKEEGFSARPSTLTIGTRILPMVKGLSFLLAVDVGTTGRKNFVRELSPTAPYNVMFGISHAYDYKPVPPVRIEVPVETPVAAATVEGPSGRIMGTVVERGAGTGVADAVIRFPETEYSGIVSGADGKFGSYRLKPGQYTLELSAPGYKPNTCVAMLPDTGDDAEITCELAAEPKLGDVKGEVKDDRGDPVPNVTVQVRGPATRSLSTNDDGVFQERGLPPGTYMVTVQGEEHLIRQDTFTVEDREESTPTIVIARKPRRASVSIRGKRIALRRKLQFTKDNNIRKASIGVMSEVADLLLRKPELLRVEIQAHMDNSTGGRAKGISEARADAVKSWLVAAGVSADRLTTVGYGSSRPLVPNITPAGRARNQRVVLTITERTDE